MIDLERSLATKTVQECVITPELEPSQVWDTGDLVHIVYWRPIPMPGKPDSGEWDVMTATLIAAGSKLCCELHVPSTPPWCGGAWEAPPGSSLRFVDPDRAFRDEVAARKAASLLPKKPA